MSLVTTTTTTTHCFWQVYVLVHWCYSDCCYYFCFSWITSISGSAAWNVSTTTASNAGFATLLQQQPQSWRGSAWLLSLRLMPIMPWVLHRSVVQHWTSHWFFMGVFIMVYTFYFQVPMWLQFTSVGDQMKQWVFTIASLWSITIAEFFLPGVGLRPRRVQWVATSSTASSWGVSYATQTDFLLCFLIFFSLTGLFLLERQAFNRFSCLHQVLKKIFP